MGERRVSQGCSGSCWNLTPSYEFWSFWAKLSWSAVGTLLNTSFVARQMWVEFKEITKFWFLSLNCHFLGEITKMITRMNSRNWTNSPYFFYFYVKTPHRNGHFQKISKIRMKSKFVIIRGFTLLIIFVILPQKWKI